jgi:outer membrane lipoprotein-sorting protein
MPSATHILRMSDFPSRRRLLLGGALLGAAALLSRPARAAVSAARLSDQDRAEVARVVAYLNGIHTLESPFEQTAGDGSVSTGTLYVERPGKLRLNYNPPMPVTIVADGSGVYYWDSKLEQLTQTRVEDTPAWFLLRPNITARGDVTVTQFEHQPGVIRLTLVETRHSDLGSVTLTLSDQPLELRQWTVVDAQGRPVTVALTDPRFGMPIPATEFDWIDPRTGLNRLPH